jgi:single-strand DNA-binding protein
MYLNKALVCGNLTRDPEVKVLPSETKVCSFSVATNSSYTTKGGERVDKVEYHNVVVFGKTAENCGKFLKKGQSVLVEGPMSTRSWDKPDGSKAYRMEIIAQTVQFGSRKTPQESDTATETEKTIDITDEVETPEKTQNKSKIVEPIPYPTEDINPDDIPF